MDHLLMDLDKISSINNEDSYEKWETMMRLTGGRGDGDEEDTNTHTNELRKGQWTLEEDSKLTSAVKVHGEGRWSTLASLAGLRRSGKSCRLRWLNYLRPDLKRGTFALDEQLHILQLHLQLGNRWSKIAEYLPGRTDNEIKNYWRTKVQKLAKQFNYDVNSPEFGDALHHIWIPRLVEQIKANANATGQCNMAAITECPYNNGGLGLINMDYNNGPVNCNLYDTQVFWDETTMGQNIIGDAALFPKPTNIPAYFEAQTTSPESSNELDINWEHIDDCLWEMTLNDEDNMLFWQQAMDYVA